MMDMLWFLFDIVGLLKLLYLIVVEMSFGGNCNVGVGLRVIFFLNFGLLGFFFYLNGIEE